MTTTSSMRAAAVAAIVAALGAVAIYGPSVLGPDAPYGHFVIGDGGNPPANCATVEADVLIERAGWAALGVDSGPVYAFARVEVSADDGGADLSAGDSIAGGGFVAAYTYPDAIACAPGQPEIEVWVQGRPDAPFKCACAIPDAGALVPQADGGTAPAPLGVTLSAWVRDAGGVMPKTCFELGGVSSWPSECAP